MIERAVVLLLLGGLLLGVALVLLPFLTAVLFAVVLAVATWPLRSALVRLGLTRRLAALLMVLLGLALVGLPLLATTPRLASRIGEGARLLQTSLATLPQAPPDWISGMPVLGKRLSLAWHELAVEEGGLRRAVDSYADWLMHGVLAVARGLVDSMLQFLLALVVAGTFWASGDTLGRVLMDVVQRLGGAPAVVALQAAGGALRSVAYGVVGTACFQGVAMGIGAGISGVPGAMALGFLVLLLAISQIGQLFIPFVWGGAAWWLFRHDAAGWGAFMAAWGLLLVSASDNLIRPWLISRGVEMPLALVILGVFGGFISFGFLGLFTGPVLLAVAFTLLQAWRGGGSPTVK
ncbi:AI-2E family transporter [Teichococcus oryzae]|nr:AI-2E family transporter [Pseudoroseomonas oryzae]